MSFELFQAGRLIGHVIGRIGSIFAYTADGTPLGTFNSIDDAAAAMLRRLAA